MTRPIAALLLGLAVAAAMLFATECLGLLLFPPPSGFPLETGEDLVRLAASAAPGRRYLMAAGWMLAAFAGGFTAAGISRHHYTGMALAVGTLVAAGIALNALVLPQSPLDDTGRPAAALARGVARRATRHKAQAALAGGLTPETGHTAATGYPSPPARDRDGTGIAGSPSWWNACAPKTAPRKP